MFLKNICITWSVVFFQRLKTVILINYKGDYLGSVPFCLGAGSSGNLLRNCWVWVVWKKEKKRKDFVVAYLSWTELRLYNFWDLFLFSAGPLGCTCGKNSAGLLEDSLKLNPRKALIKQNSKESSCHWSEHVHHAQKTLALKQCCPKHLGSANNSAMEFLNSVFFYLAEGPCFSIEERLLFAGKCTGLCLLCSPPCCIWALIAYIPFLFSLSIIH